MHIRGMEQEVMAQILKNVSVSFFPNVPGQVSPINQHVCKKLITYLRIISTD